MQRHSLGRFNAGARARQRRELRLDAAAEVLAERHTAGVTMEASLPAPASTRPLPDRHLDNAQPVVVKLYVRFKSPSASPSAVGAGGR
jgi:hypothetical protein